MNVPWILVCAATLFLMFLLDVDAQDAWRWGILFLLLGVVASSSARTGR